LSRVDGVTVREERISGAINILVRPRAGTSRRIPADISRSMFRLAARWVTPSTCLARLMVMAGTSNSASTNAGSAAEERGPTTLDRRSLRSW
jgi:hypothetical protein